MYSYLPTRSQVGISRRYNHIPHIYSRYREDEQQRQQHDSTKMIKQNNPVSALDDC